MVAMDTKFGIIGGEGGDALSPVRESKIFFLIIQAEKFLRGD